MEFTKYFQEALDKTLMQYNTFTLLLRKGMRREGKFPIWNRKLYKKDNSIRTLKKASIYLTNIFHKIDISSIQNLYEIKFLVF